MTDTPPNVVVYSGSFCAACVRAKRLLDSKGVRYTEINVEESDEARTEMLKRSGGRRTIPQIFVGDRHLGGADDIIALDRKGELDPLLAQSASA
jgi:glutaredoxin 3